MTLPSFFGGFKVTLKQVLQAAGHSPVPQGQAGETPPCPRPPRPQPVRGRHGEVHRLRAVRGCVPGGLRIYVRGADKLRTTPVSPGERYGFVYEINYLRCIHCDLCVEACPTEAITESKMFEFSFVNRADAIYTRADPWSVTTANLSRCRGRTGARVRTSTRRPGCGRRLLRVRPPTRARSSGRAEPRVRGTGTRRWPERQAGRRPRTGNISIRTAERRKIPRSAGGKVHLMGHLMLAATLPDSITFAIAAVITIVGALGVVLSRNPVHAALNLIMTLFGVAVLFVEEDAQFLAAVQVIVYAGAIVVLFLFVIMLLGVDRQESLAADPMPRQRWVALGSACSALPR